jgi:hypothetical protein
VTTEQDPGSPAPDQARPDRDREDRAQPDSTAWDVAWLVDRCTAVLGRPLTAYITATSSVAELETRAARGVSTPDPDFSHGRLQATAEIIEIFAAANRATLTGAWLRQVAAITGDPRPPAAVLRASADITATSLVARAAGSYLDAQVRTRRRGP